MKEKNMTLKETREKAGLSVETAAKLAGFPVKTYEAWESGEKQPVKFIESMLLDKFTKMIKE